MIAGEQKDPRSGSLKRVIIRNKKILRKHKRRGIYTHSLYGTFDWLYCAKQIYVYSFVVKSSLSTYGAYWLFAGVGLLAALFGVLVLPDTKVGNMYYSFNNQVSHHSSNSLTDCTKLSLKHNPRKFSEFQLSPFCFCYITLNVKTIFLSSRIR